MKLDAIGNEEYVTQFGTPEDDFSYSITGVSADRIFVCGSTWGDFAGKNRGMIDGFTGEFTTNGKLVKYNQFGTDGFDIAMILCVDDDTNIYVGGSTSGNFGGPQLGEGDCFLLQLTPDDKILWNSQFGTKSHDGVRSIDFDKTTHDNILISGIMNLPPAMAFIRMYKKDGPLIWERKFTAVGKITGTSGKDVSIDSKGNIYHAGLTGANMFGTLIGENDVYLVKLGTDK
jgi:hypothetical protein